MTAHSITLIWEGSATIKEAAELIAQGRPLELQLPPDTHFALYTHLCPGREEPETIDLDGGPELLERAAEVNAVKALAELVPVLRKTGARVHIISPSPAIRIDFEFD